MKKTILISVSALSALLSGCGHGEDLPLREEESPRVELRGSMNSIGATRGIIHPLSDGLPPQQLGIGIVTTALDTQDPSHVPAPADWENPLTFLSRGFFGGNQPGDTPAGMGSSWNGNIEYTNGEGNALQQVFYDETGVYFYFVAVHPHYAIENLESGSVISDTQGASVIFAVDGSQDIMASNMGSGNLANQWAGILSFSHKLAGLNCLFIAENEAAANAYGDIVSVELTGQPDRLGLNIGVQAIPATSGDALFNASTSTAEYPIVDSTGDGDWSLPYSAGGGYNAADAKTLGYMLVMPAQTYTFRIITLERGAVNPLYVTYDFGALSLPEAGTIYNLTFKMLESAGIALSVEAADEWWLDQTFD